MSAAVDLSPKRALKHALNAYLAATLAWDREYREKGPNVLILLARQRMLGRAWVDAMRAAGELP